MKKDKQIEEALAAFDFEKARHMMALCGELKEGLQTIDDLKELARVALTVLFETGNDNYTVVPFVAIKEGEMIRLIYAPVRTKWI